MKVYLWQKIAILLLLIFVVTFVAGMVDASNPLSPTLPTPPAQGCTTPTGAKFTTCAFYVVASSISQTSNDAGLKPECNYEIAAPEIYLGRCNLVSTPIVSGFRFQNVSIAIPTGQSILASYIEFTVDGTYTNQVVANIYGQRATPTPKAFSGTNASDINNRLTVPPTAQWKIESSARVNNMGDPWSFGETRRTPDITAMLSAIKGTSWQTNSNIVFLLKSDYQTSTAARRVMAFERAGYKPSRLVARVGQIPKSSVSYYWQSVNCPTIPPIICTPKTTPLDNKAKKEAQRNRPVLAILDFGNPKANSTEMGTTLVNNPDKYVSIAKIETAIRRYITTFMNNDLTNSKLWLGVGTNNAGDLICSETTDYASRHGTQWGDMIDRLNDWIKQQNYNTLTNVKVKVSAAIDIETWNSDEDDPSILVCPGRTLMEAPPSEALHWANAYSAATDYEYINFGNFSDGMEVLGLSRWGADLTWELSWGIPEARVLPEIYTPDGTLSAQWQTLARYSAICQGPSVQSQCQPEKRAADPNWTKGRTMQFLGKLTNYGEQRCSSNANSPNQGWLQLYRHLVVDLYTDNDFPAYSSDITYEDYGTSAHPTADTCPTP